MAESCKDLPEECWELIFNRLGHHSHHQSPSLSSKQLLSITNRLRTHFTIVDPTIFIHGTLSPLFHRFSLINSITLRSFHGDLDRVIREIAESDLSLESLDLSDNDRLPLEGLKLLGFKKKNLRVLKCAELRVLRDVELGVIGDSMPCLEELDISYPTNDLGSNPQLGNLSQGEVGITDSGIANMSRKLRGLRKIHVSGNPFLTEKSLFALSFNCALLEDLVILRCPLVTGYGIEFVMHNSLNLSSFTVSGMRISCIYDYPLTFARGLSDIRIYNSVVPDGYLYLLANAGIPLKKFALGISTGFTFSGISSLLNAYWSLEELDLMDINFLTDENMSDLCEYLSGLVMISLCSCSKLTESTIFTLANKCPLLRDINMVHTNLGGGGGGSTADIVKNPRIKFLKLASNLNLTDECLGKLASVCPSLEVLSVFSCKGITEKGIAEFFKNGSKIRYLDISRCGRIRNIGTGFELPKLEVIQAAGSGIDDRGLAMVGRRCRGILTMDLEGCLGVTTAGLKEILANCKQLREINFNRCVKVSTQTVDWLVFSRPSLRKIILPHPSLPSESQRNLFLRHGCLVLSESAVLKRKNP